MVKMTIKVDGMMCGMCEAHVNDAVRRAVPVKKVTSSHTKGETIVLADEGIDEEKLKEAINQTGYTVLSMKTEQQAEKKGLFSRFK